MYKLIIKTAVVFALTICAVGATGRIETDRLFCMPFGEGFRRITVRDYWGRILFNDHCSNLQRARDETARTRGVRPGQIAFKILGDGNYRADISPNYEWPGLGNLSTQEVMQRFRDALPSELWEMVGAPALVGGAINVFGGLGYSPKVFSIRLPEQSELSVWFGRTLETRVESRTYIRTDTLLHLLGTLLEKLAPLSDEVTIHFEPNTTNALFGEVLTKTIPSRQRNQISKPHKHRRTKAKRSSNRIRFIPFKIRLCDLVDAI